MFNKKEKKSFWSGFDIGIIWGFERALNTSLDSNSYIINFVKENLTPENIFYIPIKFAIVVALILGIIGVIQSIYDSSHKFDPYFIVISIVGIFLGFITGFILINI